MCKLPTFEDKLPTIAVRGVSVKPRFNMTLSAYERFAQMLRQAQGGLARPKKRRTHFVQDHRIL
jgi:hypothetical protein